MGLGVSDEQLFVLITGANSGIGLAIGQRLIDEFLATRSLSAHLVLLPTTRSEAKSRQTIRALRAYAVDAARSSPGLRSRVGPAYRWEHTVARIHVLSPQLDLCDLRGVYAFADRLVNGVLSNPDGLDDEYLVRVRIPRLDSIVCNAAYGGWKGVDWLKATWTILTQGLIQSVTWPTFKMALPTSVLNEQPQYGYVRSLAATLPPHFPLSMALTSSCSPPNLPSAKSFAPASSATTSWPTSSSRS